ncbi:MAG: deaminase [Candidatus Woesearchaeota archaeon]
MILGIIGKKGSGKTTVANYLIKKGFRPLTLLEFNSKNYDIKLNYVIDDLTIQGIEILSSIHDFFIIEIDADDGIIKTRTNNHPMEIPYLIPDFKVYNNSTFEELFLKIDFILNNLNFSNPKERFEKTYNQIYYFDGRFITRPIKEKYYLSVAREVAKRSTCLYVRYGAIIVKNDEIISTGYVGAPRGVKSSLDKGFCLRRQLKIPSGTHYEICRSVHAEQNAIINAARSGANILDGILYFYGEKYVNNDTEIINGFPCFICKKMIINSGIKYFISLTELGKITGYDVNEWKQEWEEKDMLDCKDNYFVDYSK